MNWNLSLIYKDNDAFEADFKAVDDDIKEVLSLKGTLGTYEGFKKYTKVYTNSAIRIGKLYVYSEMANDLNQKDKDNARRKARMDARYAQFAQSFSFASPEILAAGKDKIMEFVNTPELSDFKFYAENLFRLNEHILDEKNEAIMASYEEAGSVFNRLYSQLCIVDNHANDVTLEDGTVISVNNSNMVYYLSTLKNPSDRTRVFESVYQFYDMHKETLASIYAGIMKEEKASATSRGYKSMIEAKLNSENIPVDVYLSLIKASKETSQGLKRYYEIRRKYFGLDKVRTYDRHLSMASSNHNYSYAEGKKLVLEAMDFMGPDFKKRAEFCLSEGRVDVDVRDGKRTGAYSTSSYNEGPFILLNHNGSLNDVFTIAHECGHSIHTTYSNDNQAYVNANYSLFVAEVASTFNEQRFLDYMMEHTTDKNEKLVLLEEAINSIAATYYRQALFADYEYQAHKLVEEGQPVDSDALCEIMKGLYKDYYDINLDNEKYKAFVWAYVPHFFNYPFYVYQYATSFSASMAIYDAIRNKKPGAYDAYIRLLQSGGSDYPVELLKKAGVDLTTTEPFMAVSRRLDVLLDELEKTLA